MRVRLIIYFVFFSCIVNAQVKNDTLLIFNKKLPKKNFTVNLEDILLTDTIFLNIENLKIIEYSCSITCDVDWERNNKSNLLDSNTKNLIKFCGLNGNKIFFYNVLAVDQNGKIIKIKDWSFRIKTLDKQ